MIIVAITVFVCGVAFLLDGHKGFTLMDEGYLWYGVQRTVLGDMPLRDFMSYDPARYYWAAALVNLFGGPSIVAVRAATAAFFAAAVALAIWLVWEALKECAWRRLALALVAAPLCLLWGMPWWKQYDEAMSIMLVASMAYLLSQPIAWRFFLHGVIVGIAAMFGRNHGIYGVLACLIAFPFLMFSRERPVWHRCVPAWMGGLLAGFSPILLALLCDHRFLLMFWDSLRFVLFEYKSTNIPLPIPWPWTLPTPSLSTYMGMRLWLTGSFYVMMPLLCLGGLVKLIHTQVREGRLTYPIFAACLFTALPYLNVAYSRADVPHLAQSIFPLILAVLCVPWQGRYANWLGAISAGVLVVVSVCVALPLHPAYAAETNTDWRFANVSGDRLLMESGVADSVEDIQRIATRYRGKDDTVLSVPIWPGLYALLGVKSPVYEIYPLFPRSNAFQQQEIERLIQAKPSIVFFDDVGVDGRNDMRYGSTHPLMTQYIEQHYREIPSPAAEPQLKIYVLR
jgi:hypothetical protein